ncbi:PTS sugar transporter subunit IIB [Brevibacillus fluminis]|uniref:PTS sugar transporter subunit IIB n=1 Tax=Brevibacillus fluminis TaxID=511487 RepID=UPI003F8A196F
MNILLCCSAGMSTSLLVQKMKQAADEKGMQVRIWAVGAEEVSQHIAEADVLLLGPQVRYKLTQMKELAAARGIPVEVISTMDYGTLNGKKVLEFALSLKK